MLKETARWTSASTTQLWGYDGRLLETLGTGAGVESSTVSSGDLIVE